MKKEVMIERDNIVTQTMRIVVVVEAADGTTEDQLKALALGYANDDAAILDFEGATWYPEDESVDEFGKAQVVEIGEGDGRPDVVKG
jgi:hypothetical protein